MLQFDAREIKEMIDEILGARLGLWFRRLLVFAAFIGVVKLLSDWLSPFVSGLVAAIAAAVSGAGLSAQWSEWVSLLVTFVVAFLVVYGSRVTASGLSRRLEQAGRTAELGLRGSKIALADLESLRGEFGRMSEDAKKLREEDFAGLNARLAQLIEFVGRGLEIQGYLLEQNKQWIDRIGRVEQRLGLDMVTLPPPPLPSTDQSRTPPTG